jgi:glucose/arabinose dehydrogenase
VAHGGIRFLALWAVLLCACGECEQAPQSNSCKLIEKGFGPAGKTRLRAEVVVDGLEVPWSLSFLPGGDILVTERPGRIRLVHNGALVPAPVATIQTDPGGEGGLQGLAIHPRFSENRLFYVFFTVQTPRGKRNRVERWRLSEDRRSASFETRLMDDLPAAQFHHGGRIRFGPDGMLYVSAGDARQPDSAQDPKSPSGKLHRLTPDGQPAAGNPFSGSTVFLLGLRNVEGFDWQDPQTLVLADHGPSGELNRSGHDEVTVARKGDNLGWPTIYGCEARKGLLSPSIAWVEALPPGGAAIYTGDAIPGWKGSLVMGVLGAKQLHRIVFGSDRRTVASNEVYFEGDPPAGLGRLRDVVMGPDGQLYVTTSNCDGRGRCPPEKDKIIRILPAG